MLACLCGGREPVAAGGNGAEEEGEGLLARLGIDLAGFIDKYGLAQV